MTKSNQRDPDRIKQEFRQMYRDLMDQTLGSDEDLYGTQDEPVSQVPARVGMGKYRKKFAQVWNGLASPFTENLSVYKYLFKFASQMV